MTTRDDLIPVVDDARAIVAGMGLRVRPVQVVTVTRSLTGAASLTTPGKGLSTDPLTITPRPRVRNAIDRRSGVAGVYEAGDLVIDRISATYTEAELNPAIDEAADVHWLVDGRECVLLSLEHRNFEWRAHVRPRRDR